MIRFELRRCVARLWSTSTIAKRRGAATRRPVVQALESRVLPSAGLVRDISNANAPGDSSGPSWITEVNGTLFFSADDGVHGRELWKSDGTSSGTVLVRDIWMFNYDIVSSNPAFLTNVNGTLFFAADGESGRQLWKSDGTSSGTVLVRDIGGLYGNPELLTNVGGTLFFRANDMYASGVELWKSDGTFTGTVLVKDINPYGVSGVYDGSYPEHFTNVNGTLFFTARDPEEGTELWKSNGTSTGTVRVRNIDSRPTLGSYPSLLTNANGTLFFRVYSPDKGEELWKSNGTSSGTVLVKDILSGSGSSDPAGFTNMNGTLYFTATDGNTGDELWKSDGTSSGTVLVRDIYSGSNPSSAYWLTNVNGTLFFAATDGVNGSELWKSDGTSAGTVLVRDIVSGVQGSDPNWLTNVNGTLYFRPNNGTTGEELWKSDGTSAGTVLVKSFGGPFSSPIGGLTNLSGTLYFTVDDGTHGDELWKAWQNSAPTNLTLSTSSLAENQASGTSVGTFSTNDPDTGDTFTYTLVGGAGSADNASFTIDGGTLKTAESFNFETKSSYLIRVRSTDQGGLSVEKEFTITVRNLRVTLVADLFPSPYSDLEYLTEVNGTLFFSANDGSNGYELWKSDGTSTGTVLVKDIRSSGSSHPAFLVNVNGTLFFSATDGSNGYELWKSDGTSTGTVLVKDIRSSGSSDPEYLTNVNGTLYFKANDGISGYELWKSDGTSSGTVRVRDIYSGSVGSSPYNLTNINGILYFSADSLNSGNELWKSDGTSAGTVKVREIRSGADGSYPVYLTNVNGILYFSADNGGNGYELWKSDGTSAGTVLVKDILGGAEESSEPKYLTNVNGTLYFQADDGISGAELWKSNGTSTGTVLVKNIDDTEWGSFPTRLTNVNGTLYFEAADGAGSELWKSDGTSTGTVLVRDIQSNWGSYPNYLSNVDGTLYFSANDGITGTGLWRSDGTSAGTFLIEDISGGVGGSDPEYLTNVNGVVYYVATGSTGKGLWRTIEVENSPPSDISLSSTSIVENQPTGTTVGSFSTTDPDVGTPFRYTLVSGTGDTDNASFTIDGGMLKTAASFDFETKSSYAIRVRSTDQGDLFVEKELTITVTNVNETPTNIILSATSIAENQAIGTAVGSFSTTDPDAGNTFTYTLVSGTGSTDNASFTIDGGTLKAAASFDFETKSSYAIRVRSTDQGGLFFEKDFTITVLDGNDVPTNVSLSNVVSVLLANVDTTNAIRLADVSFTDDGLGTNSLSVSGADATVFEVVNNQLRLKAGTTLNFATQKTYVVSVNVDDATLGSTPDASVTYTLNLQGLNATAVQNGSVGRSYVRYVSLNFNTALALPEAVATVGTANSRIRLFFGGTSGTQAVARTLTAGMVSLVGNQVKLDFGVNGVGGDRNSSLGDGIYRLRVDLDGDGTAEITGTFFRLFGDVDGNGVVNDTDIALVTAAQGISGLNLTTDLNGDGFVNATDLTNVKRRRGARVTL